MKKLFLNHPQHAGETFWVHFKFAVWAGLRMIVAGIICIIHAFCPFLFEHTASKIIIPLAKELSSRVDTIKDSKKRKNERK
jgi:hypothetical protein